MQLSAKLILLIGLTGTVAGQSTSPPVSIVISALEPVVKSGSGVFIKVQMTNISDQAVDCTATYLGATDRKYPYDVKDDAGTSIKRRIIRPEQDAGSI